MGRPRIEIDQKQFESLCGLQCTLAEIASFFQCSEDTIERWCKRTYDITFADAYKNGTVELVMDLRGELARIAFKHTLETKKVYTKKDEETGHSTRYVEITTKEVDGDIAAINLLLKNLDENWSNDPQNLALRKQELELRKAIAAANNFDINLEDLGK